MENTKNISEANAVQMNPALLYERTYHYITDSNKIPRYVVPTVNRLLRYQGANEYCFPSLKTLAKDLKVSVQTVLNHIRILKEAGVLKVVQQINSNGGWGNNRYYLKTDFLSWVTKEMLEDANKPYYKEYYDELTASGSNAEENTSDEESCTEKEPSPAGNSSGTSNSNVYDVNFLEEQYKLSELRDEAEDDTYTAETVDLMENILLDVLNSEDDKIYNVKSLKPAIVIKSVFLKMTKTSILATMREYVSYVKNLASGKKIYNHQKFMISMLYNNFLEAMGNSIDYNLTGNVS